MHRKGRSVNTERDNDRVASGGKAVYGARLGILMLEARFPRIPGDMGNAETWPFPVLYKVVAGASPERVVRQKAAGLLEDFLAAAEELVRLGADGITTTCGFLSLYQREIATHAGVPVATSSLMQIPFIERILPPERRVGVITISAASLNSIPSSEMSISSVSPNISRIALSSFLRVDGSTEPSAWTRQTSFLAQSWTSSTLASRVIVPTSSTDR